MKRLATLLTILLLSARMACAEVSPCENYQLALAYARTVDPATVTLTLDEEQTKAEIELKIARNYTAIFGNQTSGRQCLIRLELMWPSLMPGGPVPGLQKRIRDRMVGDFPAWRALTIDVTIERQAWADWMLPAGYCGMRSRLAELPGRPFGLRAFDDGIKWPSHVQGDRTYRNMQELMPYPLNSANHFYFIDSNSPEDMISISCTKGAPRCGLHGHIGGFRTTTLFNSEDIENWRSYRDSVRQFLMERTVRSSPALQPPNPGRHTDPAPALVACMREMEGSVGSETLRRMGLGK